MNIEIYNRLKEFERTLTTAYKADYVISLPYAKAEELTNIYNEAYHQNKRTSRCSKCVLEIAKRLGKDYFDFQSRIEQTKVEEKPVAVEEPKHTQTKKTAKKKKGGSK